MGKLTEFITQEAPGKKVLLMGNQAIARGAIEAGVQVAASYPGTPASEILETLAEAAQKMGFHAEWSTNEKVAFEVAAGAALTGVRAITSMKNAGLNWVMDMFMTLVYGGVRGGFVIAVGDDPDAHYSSNEQDTRFAAFYAAIPCLEPSNAQEAKDMCKYAFELSERLELPVFLRSVTRISHASGDVELGPIETLNRRPVFDKHWRMGWRWNVYGPPGPVEKHRWLLSKAPEIEKIVEDLPWNELKIEGSPEVGIISSGIAASYAKDALQLLGVERKVAFLKLAAPVPIAKGLASKILKTVKKVLIIEEGEPVVELQVRSFAKDVAPQVEVLGRLTGEMPKVGEINPDVAKGAIAKVLGIEIKSDVDREKAKQEAEKLVAPRSSTLCAGCPHLGSYWALKQAMKKVGGKVPIVNGDIGCYEQGGYGIAGKEYKPSDSKESKGYPIEAPYETLDTNYIMGGGVGLMQGQFHAGYKDGPIVAVAGDSTFFHACLPAIINATYNKAKGLFLVMDNYWTAMTGHQPDPCTGVTATGEEAKILSIEKIAKALGIEFVEITDPSDLKATQETIEKALKSDKFAIVVTRKVCTLQALRLKQYKPVAKQTRVNEEKCTGCKLCVSFGCPATTFDIKRKKAGIDPILCVNCGMCKQVCPFEAIEEVKE